MLELYNITFSSKSGPFNSSQNKLIRFSFKDYLVISNNVGKNINQSTIEWKEQIRTPEIYDQSINFEIYNKHSVGQRTQKLTIIGYGSIILRKDKLKGKCEIFSSQQSNKVIGYLSFQYKKASDELSANNQQGTKKKVEIFILVKGLVQKPKNSYLVLYNKTGPLKGAKVVPIHQKDGQFTFCLQASKKFLRQVGIVFDFHDENGKKYGRAAFRTQNWEEMMKSPILDQENQRVGDAFINYQQKNKIQNIQQPDSNKKKSKKIDQPENHKYKSSKLQNSRLQSLVEKLQQLVQKQNQILNKQPISFNGTPVKKEMIKEPQNDKVLQIKLEDPKKYGAQKQAIDQNKLQKYTNNSQKVNQEIKNKQNPQIVDPQKKNGPGRRTRLGNRISQQKRQLEPQTVKNQGNHKIKTSTRKVYATQAESNQIPLKQGEKTSRNIVQLKKKVKQNQLPQNKQENNHLSKLTKISQPKKLNSKQETSKLKSAYHNPSQDSTQTHTLNPSFMQGQSGIGEQNLNLITKKHDEIAKGKGQLQKILAEQIDPQKNQIGQKQQNIQNNKEEYKNGVGIKKKPIEQQNNKQKLEREDNKTQKGQIKLLNMTPVKKIIDSQNQLKVQKLGQDNKGKQNFDQEFKLGLDQSPINFKPNEKNLSKQDKKSQEQAKKVKIQSKQQEKSEESLKDKEFHLKQQEKLQQKPREIPKEQSKRVKISKQPEKSQELLKSKEFQQKQQQKIQELPKEVKNQSKQQEKSQKLIKAKKFQSKQEEKPQKLQKEKDQPKQEQKLKQEVKKSIIIKLEQKQISSNNSSNKNNQQKLKLQQPSQNKNEKVLEKVLLIKQQPQQLPKQQFSEKKQTVKLTNLPNYQPIKQKGQIYKQVEKFKLKNSSNNPTKVIQSANQDSKKLSTDNNAKIQQEKKPDLIQKSQQRSKRKRNSQNQNNEKGNKSQSERLAWQKISNIPISHQLKEKDLQQQKQRQQKKQFDSVKNLQKIVQKNIHLLKDQLDKQRKRKLLEQTLSDLQKKKISLRKHISERLLRDQLQNQFSKDYERKHSNKQRQNNTPDRLAKSSRRKNYNPGQNLSQNKKQFQSNQDQKRNYFMLSQQESQTNAYHMSDPKIPKKDKKIFSYKSQQYLDLLKQQNSLISLRFKANEGQRGNPKSFPKPNFKQMTINKYELSRRSGEQIKKKHISQVRSNKNIIFSREPRFKQKLDKKEHYQDVVSYLKLPTMDLYDQSSGRYYKGASIGKGKRLNITPPSESPGVGQYKLPPLITEQ